jgi:hypothetical protein
MPDTEVTVSLLALRNEQNQIRTFGSERESDEVRILSGFLENDEFGLGGSQALRF